MKKIFTIIILLVYANIYSQNQGIQDTEKSKPDTILRIDTIFVEKIITSIRPETVLVAKPETLKIIQSRTDTIFRRLAEKQKETDIGEIKFGFFKKINLFTFIYIIIFILLGYLVSKLINFIRRLLSANDKWYFLQNVLTLADVFVWFLVVLLIVNLIFAAPNLITFFLIITAVIFIGISSIPIIKNIIGGFYILIKKPFVTGSYLVLKNIEGVIDNIEWRATTLTNKEGGITKIPNYQFLVSPFDIIDATKKEKIISINFNFPIETDTKSIMDILKEAAISSPFSYPKKPPQVFLLEIDHINKQKKIKLNVFIFDSRYENELVSSIQKFIEEKIS